MYLRLQGSIEMAELAPKDWLELSKDDDTGIETIRAHFNGHAYDPHWHDSYLVGITEQGVQQFNCRRNTHTSLSGGSFLLEPGEIHDGKAPEYGGFTYRMLYIPQDWIKDKFLTLFDNIPSSFELNFDTTLSNNKALSASISSAFLSLHHQDPKIVKDACLDQMLEKLTINLDWRKKQSKSLEVDVIALKTQDFLHANIYTDIDLEALSRAVDTDRFRINRAFKAAFGLSPHAYLIQLRLVKARQLLSQGYQPIDVASELCFADQSHLGRWFRRVYKLTPANYQQLCTNHPDYR